MSIFTIMVLVVLAIVVGGCYVVATELGEFENEFVYAVWGVMAFIVLGSVYLSYATPTLATKETPRATQVGTTVTEDTSNLLLEE